MSSPPFPKRVIELTTPEYLFASAVEIARSIAAREVSCVEVVTTHLERIHAVNPGLNAVVTFAEERALHEAQQADKSLAAGHSCGPLHGVPITLKDSFDTEGIRSTASTEGRRHFIPDKDATAVARLRAAGAIVLGKTNTPEITIGAATESPLFGRTNNPYDQDYTPSGSSGGAAAILAAGGAALEMGSDTGGSIREPAHVCGVVGLMPSAGLVPRSGHGFPPGLGATDFITQVGPMARYVDDVALALEVIRGVDWLDTATVPVPLIKPTAPASLKVAFHTHNGLVDTDPDVAATIRSVADVLTTLGVSVTEDVPSAIAEYTDIYARMRNGDGGWGIRHVLAKWGTNTPGEGLQHRLNEAQTIPVKDFVDVLIEVDAYKRAMLGFMREYDAILCPPSSHPPLRHGNGEATRYEEWTFLSAYNLTGWPALVLRAGSTNTGLPLGVQIVGRPFEDLTVIELARLIERECGGYQRPSGL